MTGKNTIKYTVLNEEQLTMRQILLTKMRFASSPRRVRE